MGEKNKGFIIAAVVWTICHSTDIWNVYPLPTEENKTKQSQPQRPVKWWGFSGRRPLGVFLYPTSKSSLFAVQPCTSTPEPGFQGHSNQGRLRRSERSVCNKTEVAEGSLWKEACWAMPLGVWAKPNKPAQSRSKGGKQSSLPQEDPKILVSSKNTGQSTSTNENTSLGNSMSMQPKAVSWVTVDKIIRINSCISLFKRQDYLYHVWQLLGVKYNPPPHRQPLTPVD